MPDDTADPTRGSHTAWLTSGAVLTVISVLGGAFAVWQSLTGAPTATAAMMAGPHETVSRRPDGIEIDLDGGDLTVTPSAAGTVEIDRASRQGSATPTVTEQWNGNTLRITARCGGQRCETDYRVGLPADTAVQARTAAGSITTQGLRGDQRLDSDSGDIRVSGATGRLFLRTAAGNVTGTALAGGQADAETAAGQVDLGYTGAPDQVATASSAGNVRVTVPRTGQPAYRVRAEAPRGTTTVDVAQNPASGRAITARVGAGNIDIRSG